MISIIIPVYKVEKYLPACLDSVLAQTFSDWEAICVNDGSPDKCDKILNEYAAKDNRIKIITQNNQGLSIARNNGLKQAKGKYVLFLDSDDTIHPQLLEICTQVAEQEKAEMVSFRFYKRHKKDVKPIFYNPKQVKYILTNTPLYFQKKRRTYKISVNAWSKLYRRDLICDLSFIPNITMEDYPHTYAVLARNPKTVILNIGLYYYTHNPESITSSQITVKTIHDYQKGLNFVIDTYASASKKYRRHVLYKLFPGMLKNQLQEIERASMDKQAELYQAFSEELYDLYKKGWLKPWGHKIIRYLTYRRLIRKGKK